MKLRRALPASLACASSNFLFSASERGDCGGAPLKVIAEIVWISQIPILCHKA